jgi:hypothetical protein
MTTIEDVLSQAEERTGLHGLDGDSWRPGLQVIVGLLDDPRMTDGGRDLIIGRAVDALANRLRVHAYVEAHPEVRDERIERPIFILGMPRTGTTVASYLLDQDPARRSLLKWEAVDSAPPATTETLRTDPRCLAMLEQDKAILEMISASGMAIPHWEDADGPTECMFLHEQDFKGLLWDSFTPGTAYADWLLGLDDAVSAYEYQKLVLQVLQSGAPGRWNLKMPSHSVFLASLLAVFPDAQLVWAHRDPFKATGSLCNLLMLPASMTLQPEAIDKHALGQNCKEQMRQHVDRALEVRERIGDDRFFHLHYADTLRDPLGQMRALYDWVGDELSPAVEVRMERWLADNPQHKLGVTSYTLDEYGLSEEELDPVFAPYLEAFDVELEGGA